MEVIEVGHGRRQELCLKSVHGHGGGTSIITNLTPVVLCGTWANLLRWLKTVNFEATQIDPCTLFSVRD